MSTKNLCAAILAVYGAVLGVGKDSENTGQRYKYVSDEGLILAIKPAMQENGLVLLPVSKKVVVDELTTSKGSKMVHVIITATWLLLHSSGESIELQSIGEGADSMDKAAYKAETGALKYAIRQAFLLATGEDAEREQKQVERRKEAEKPYVRDESQDAVAKRKETMSWLAPVLKEAVATLEADGCPGEAAALTYDNLKGYCFYLQESKGKPKVPPSMMGRDGAGKLLRAIGVSAGDHTVSVDSAGWLAFYDWTQR